MASDEPVRPGHSHLLTASRPTWTLAATGLLGLFMAVLLQPAAAGSAASQVWSPFVLVAGLLLIGLVANDDGLFAALGHRLARTARTGTSTFVGATLMVGVVTVLLNLDTAVVFLTPVLVYTARSRGGGEAPLLYGCLMLANAGSLFLPGSNLTNLIVLGHLHLTGGQFFAHMWAPALAALVVTGSVVAVFEHRTLRIRADHPGPPERPVLGLGIVSVVLATVFVLTFPNASLPVIAVGIASITVRIASGKDTVGHVIDALGLPVLVGLFGVAVALGTLGRVWIGPQTLLSHLDVWGTAVVASVSTVLMNNLPAASLLSAQHPPHPFALLIGLNVGPNLFVSGSLAWFLWLRAARSAGARPSLARATRLGMVTVPISLTVAVGVLILTGST